MFRFRIINFHAEHRKPSEKFFTRRLGRLSIFFN